MKITSNSSTATVTPMVMSHSSEETFIYRPPGVTNVRGLFRRCERGPRHRTTDVGRRGDDTATKEYSPRTAVCQVRGQLSKPGTGSAAGTGRVRHRDVDDAA
jgi:hypothetical protein